MKVELKLDGIEELKQALQQLADDVRDKLMIEAMLAAGEPIRQEAASRAPVRKGGGGTLSRTITVEAGKKHVPSVRIGIGAAAWYGRFIEIGTKQRKTKTGASRGQMTAQPFLKPALAARRTEALEKFREVIRRGLGMD